LIFFCQLPLSFRQVDQDALAITEMNSTILKEQTKQNFQIQPKTQPKEQTKQKTTSGTIKVDPAKHCWEK